MYKSLYILIVFFVLAGIDASAQNLVLNYNFDNAFTCPHHYTTTAVKELVPHWTNPNKGTPDHFHACSDSLAGVPDNFAGFIYPFDGRAYVGLILREVFDSTHKNVPGVSREYLQTRLTEPMMRNKLYCVSLYYAHASRSAYAVDAMGIAITRDQIRTRDPGNIVQMPQVINRPGRIMNNKESWKELCGVYRARGNEKYLTIGNFLNNEYTRFEKNLDEMTDSTFLYAYYYIDAVRVFEIENHFECGCSEEDSFGMDMMADNYDPKTGYNSLNYTRRLEEDMASMTELGDGNADDLLSDGSLSDSDGDGNADDLLSDGSLSDSDGNADDLLSDGSLSDSDGDGNADDLLSDGSLSDSDDDGNADDLLSDGSLSDSDGDDNADKTDVLYSGDFDGREQVPGSGFYNPYAHLSSEISDEAFETIKIGDSFRLNRIFFEFNSAELLTPSFIELDRLSEILINRENILIEIHGHTDNIGSTSYNRRLSNRRAEAVYDYLHEKGVGKHQMKYKGFGSSEPVADNETNQGRSENRRVEIMISDL
jgi:outer membrane protein OmpA-like peptidoglycan-associated protein